MEQRTWNAPEPGKKLKASSLLDFLKLANRFLLDMIWILSVQTLRKSPWRVVAQISGVSGSSPFEKGPDPSGGKGGPQIIDAHRTADGWAFNVFG
ncbi:MAG: hypothetical protein CM1200mP14_01370 [Gammaproteobacteria bacterium]|nr:MAG: hypothetical protein CM1200mP14_01370 [Gammaproteobacteria bacterium]